MQDGFGDCDQALITRASDDPRTFQQLYERYFKRVYRYVASRIDNQHDAEDAVSEVFLRVIQHLPQLRSQYPVSFAAWLFTIARNTVMDYYRRKEAAGTVLSPPAVETIDPDTMLIQGEDAARLREMIAGLPERKREVVMLKYYGGLRNQEIAVVLQIGEKTVAAYLSRALDELHAQYTAQTSEQKVGDHD